MNARQNSLGLIDTRRDNSSDSAGARGYTYTQNSLLSLNKFRALYGDNCVSDEQYMSTPSCAGKKKATSPLDTEQTLKKQRESTSVSSETNDA